jgi:hypothetical protein
MVSAWNDNMHTNFTPGWISFLDGQDWLLAFRWFGWSGGGNVANPCHRPGAHLPHMLEAITQVACDGVGVPAEPEGAIFVRDPCVV